MSNMDDFIKRRRRCWRGSSERSERSATRRFRTSARLSELLYIMTPTHRYASPCHCNPRSSATNTTDPTVLHRDLDFLRHLHKDEDSPKDWSGDDGDLSMMLRSFAKNCDCSLQIKPSPCPASRPTRSRTSLPASLPSSQRSQSSPPCLRPSSASCSPPPHEPRLLHELERETRRLKL